MATEPSVQRSYRAACPNCGAPVDFRSAASAFAVCSFCRSTVVREGDALKKIGHSAELFTDYSPLQLGASGTYQGASFTLVGRLQYQYRDGVWNEWNALFDSGKSAWLSEDNGRYVLAFDVPLQEPAPMAEILQVDVRQVIGGHTWVVASVALAKLLAAQGELPTKPPIDQEFVVADLRNTRDEVGTLDYSDAISPKWSVGRSVSIAELAMSGLTETAEKSLKARGMQCPSCGAAQEIKLSTTMSVVCHQCRAVLDVSQGVGGDIQHYTQQNGAEPQIPLGSMGTLALGGSQTLLPWQVVGYAERCEVAHADDDEQSFWREYLLYHRTAGFAFLVDAQDGWSWAQPITGVPEVMGDKVKYQGALYRKLYTYTGKTTYVLGEFYWRLERDQLTHNTDYQGTGKVAAKKLNREQTGSGNAQEIVWSGGETMAVDAVLKAFRLEPKARAALRRDASPTSSSHAGLLAKAFLFFFVVVVLLTLFRCGSREDCDGLRSTYGEASQEYQSCLNNNRSSGRTGGGSYGGFSSGGGHK